MPSWRSWQIGQASWPCPFTWIIGIISAGKTPSPIRQIPGASEITRTRYGLPYVFTPQMIVNGVFQGSGSDRSRIAGFIDSAALVRKPWVEVSLSRLEAGKVQVQLPDTAYGGEAEVVLVRFDKSLRTEVSKGENVGRALKNVHVVRQFRPIAIWRGDKLTLTVPLEDLGGVGLDFAAVIVQEVGQGQVLGVAVLALR